MKQGSKHSEETKRKISKARLGTKWSLESKKRRSLAYTGSGNPRFGKHCTLEMKARLSKKLSGNKNAEGAKRLDLAEYNRTHIHRGKDNPNYGNHVLKGIPKTLEHRRKMSQVRIARGLSKGKLNPMSNPTIVAKWFRAINKKPNKAELKLLSLLLKYFDDWRFVGAGDLLIGNKCPDFTNGNGKIIELYGDFFHRNDDPQDRIVFFKKFGFDTLVVWERELKDEASLVERLVEFNGGVAG